MDILDLVVNLFTNTDAFLVSLATDYGTLIYAAMFLIFFLETGFVIMSFLPGDSLLFVAGTVAASGTASPWLIMLAVIVGAIAGNTLGYEQGRWLGNRIYSGNISWINEKKLRHAHDFYMRHGGKTILLARFVPIVRAFAPLIAGAARMNGIRFELFSGAGAILWACLDRRRRLPLRQHPVHQEQPLSHPSPRHRRRHLRPRPRGHGLEVHPEAKGT